MAAPTVGGTIVCSVMSVPDETTLSCGEQMIVITENGETICAADGALAHAVDGAVPSFVLFEGCREMTTKTVSAELVLTT